MTDDPRPLIRFALFQKVCLIAWVLFAMDQRAVEKRTVLFETLAADPGQLAALTGKYVQYGTSYVHLKLNGNAQWFEELPASIAPDQIVSDYADLSVRTPMEDRLREVARTLHDFMEQDASLADLAAGTDKVVEACRANNGELCFARIQEWIKTDFFSADATNDLADEIERAHGVLERIGQHAEKLRATLTADGLTMGGLRAIRAMILSAAGQSADLRFQSFALATSLHFVVILEKETRVEIAAQQLSDRLIRTGYETAVRAAAEELVAEGNRLIDEALAGPPITYYDSLYRAAAYQLAGLVIGRGAARVSATGACSDSDTERWAGLTANAEERAVRIETALAFAMRDHEDGGAWTALNIQEINETRQRSGERAARGKANDLIRNQLYYPTSYMPILLGESN
jgi:hypothetical protein